MIWDTHAHLNDPDFKKDLPEVAARMLEAGVTRVTNIGYDLAASEKSVQLAQDYDFIYASVGVHPHNAKEATEKTWTRLLQLVKKPKVIAWGEMGLDFYRDLSPRSVQRTVFIEQIGLANVVGLPVVIHSRDAHQDVLEIVKAHPPKLGGIFHCYAGSWEMAKILLQMGFYLSFAGPLTYKNARQSVEVASKAPLDRILVETDAPYLTPASRRGQRNEPAFVREVAEKIAELRSLPLEEVARQTWLNAEAVFRLDKTGNNKKGDNKSEANTT